MTQPELPPSLTLPYEFDTWYKTVAFTIINQLTEDPGWTHDEMAEWYLDELIRIEQEYVKIYHLYHGEFPPWIIDHLHNLASSTPRPLPAIKTQLSMEPHVSHLERPAMIRSLSCEDSALQHGMQFADRCEEGDSVLINYHYNKDMITFTSLVKRNGRMHRESDQCALDMFNPDFFTYDSSGYKLHHGRTAMMASEPLHGGAVPMLEPLPILAGCEYHPFDRLLLTPMADGTSIHGHLLPGLLEKSKQDKQEYNAAQTMEEREQLHQKHRDEFRAILEQDEKDRSVKP